MDPRWRGEIVGVIDVRSIELAVADDDTAGIEDETLVFGLGVAAPRRHPGDALREEWNFAFVPIC